MNIRTCKLCGKQVDFDEPWCDHETMEESAWLDIRERRNAAIDKAVAGMSEEQRINAAVAAAAIELGIEAGKALRRELDRLIFDRSWDAEQHRSDMDHVYQHRSRQ